MKLLYCIPELSNPGGMERILTEKVNYLSKFYKYDITIVTTEEKNNKPFFPLYDSIHLINLPLFFKDNNDNKDKNIFQRYLHKQTLLKLYKRQLEDILKKNNIDVCISLCGNEIDFLTKLNDKSKKIAEIHFGKHYHEILLTNKHKDNFLWRHLGKMLTNSLVKNTQELDKLVVLTKEDQEQWKKTNNNTTQIYNFNPLHTTLISNLDEKRFLAIGRLDSQKGFDMLIPIFKEVVKRHNDWKLDIFGQGIWKDWLNDMIKENSLQDNVFLRGVTNDITKEYSTHYAYLMSSRFEGFPMVLIEAMSCGLPCISFNCKCGPNEIIKDNENGFLVPLFDKQKMIDSICRLIEDKDLAKDMSKKAINTASCFNKENIMQLWDNLFQSLS